MDNLELFLEIMKCLDHLEEKNTLKSRSKVTSQRKNNIQLQSSFPGWAQGWSDGAGCRPCLLSCPYWSPAAPYISTHHPEGEGEGGGRGGGK